jgi:hypothetical protein
LLLDIDVDNQLLMDAAHQQYTRCERRRAAARTADGYKPSHILYARFLPLPLAALLLDADDMMVKAAAERYDEERGRKRPQL